MNICSATPICRRFDTAVAVLARDFIPATFEMRIAAKIPTIAITVSNSTSGNPPSAEGKGE